MHDYIYQLKKHTYVYFPHFCVDSTVLLGHVLIVTIRD